MYNFTKTLFILFFITSILHSQSQQLITGRVIDGENNTALENVQIININSNNFTFSNTAGEFNLTNTGTFKFKLLGYKEKTITLYDSIFNIVQLRINPSELNEVTVSANHIPQKLKKAVTTINLLTSKEIERGSNYNITHVLNQVPGVYMQSGALNTNKITIRGIGSRNLYGTSKIRAYFRDIPLTSGNGETTIEDFELNSVARFEIVKGGTSSIYGAGLGGTIHLTPKVGALNESNIGSEFSIGSFGLIKGILTANHGSKNHSFNFIYSNTHSDGYRENNEYDRQTATFNSTHFLGENDDLTFLGSFVNLKAFIPSSIDKETFKTSPSSAAYTWNLAQGYEDTNRGILGLSWNHKYQNQLKQITSIYTNFRNSYEPRPFNILSENITAFGIRSRLLGELHLLERKLKWTLGVELFSDLYNSKTFENLYKDFPPETGSVEGEILSNYQEKRSYYNLFVETNYSLTPKTNFSIGLNLNQTVYNLEDNFEMDEHIDQSGSYDFGLMLSPKFGISQSIRDHTTVYSNVSHGFSPPTLQETLLPNGLINPTIEPETGWNFEIGTRGSWIQNKLQYNLALYRLDIKNLLVARRVSEDQYIGVNAGQTQHDGLEIMLNYDWIKTDKISINSSVSYTLNDFIFKEFVDDDNDYSGNKLTGVPSNLINAGLGFDSKIGLYGNVNFQYVDSVPMTDSNTTFSESYNLTNIKFGYKSLICKSVDFDIFMGIDNVFNESYASQILINASSFGGNAPRYYYPGNPVNYYTGIRVNYLF